MKKFTNMLMGGLMLLAAASCEPDSFTQYHPEKVQAPVLAELSSEPYTLVENAAFAEMQFTPADFGVPVSVRYTLTADLAGRNFSGEKQVAMVNSPAVQAVPAAKDLNNVLIAMGCEYGKPYEVEFRLKAEWMGESAPVSVNPLYSNTVSATVIPYNAEREYAKVWVIGSYCGWSHGNSLFLYNYAEDGNVFQAVIDFGEEHSDNQFKVTGADNWDNGNWGTPKDDATPAESSSIQLWNDGGSGNVSIYKEKRYYHLTFDKATEVLTKGMSFNQVGIIGLNGDWNNDIVMTYHKAKQRFYADIEAEAATEFKFRMDADWAVNYGGSLDGLSQGGANIKLDPGKYRVYLYLNDLNSVTAVLDADAYGTTEQ